MTSKYFALMLYHDWSSVQPSRKGTSLSTVLEFDRIPLAQCGMDLTMLSIAAAIWSPSLHRNPLVSATGLPLRGGICLVEVQISL